MRTLRLSLVGMFVVALLGLTSAAAAANDNAPEAEWWMSDSEWLSLEAMRQFHLERQEVIGAEIDEAWQTYDLVRGAGLYGPIFDASMRVLEAAGGLPAGFRRQARQDAYTRYRELWEEHDNLPKWLDEIAAAQNEIETDDPERREERKAFLEKYPVPVGDHVRYSVECLEGGKVQKTRHAHDLGQLKEALKGTAWCLENPERPMTRVIHVLLKENDWKKSGKPVPAPL